MIGEEKGHHFRNFGRLATLFIKAGHVHCQMTGPYGTGYNRDKKISAVPLTNSASPLRMSVKAHLKVLNHFLELLLVRG